MSIDLQRILIPDSSCHPLPENFHERTGHILPIENNLMQVYICEAEEYADKNKMVINTVKTDAMIFTNSRSMDFPPELHFKDGTLLRTVTEKTLLGVVVSNDLKWTKNTTFICEKARRKIWILKRMLPFNFTHFELFDVYQKEVRTILEYASPVWHSGLTRHQTS